jgi:hypothetical protein
MTLFLALLMGGVALFGPAWQMALAVWAASLGLAAFREGWFGWPGPAAWSGRRPGPEEGLGEFKAMLAVLALVVLAVLLTFAEELGLPLFGLGAVGRMLTFAGVAAALGAYRMVAKVRRFDELTLRQMAGWAW